MLLSSSASKCQNLCLILINLTSIYSPPYALTLVATESYMFDIAGSFISISRQIKKTSKSVPNVLSSGSTTPDEHEQLLPIL